MDQAGLVGMLQPVGRLADIVGGDEIIHGAVVLDHLLQIAALDVLHHQVMDVAVVVDVVGPDDIAVIQGGGGLGLAMEAGQIGRVFDAMLGQDLDRPASLHEHVLGQVDAAHAAGAQVVEELVLSEEEAFVPAFEEVVALPAGQETGLDQLFSDDVGLSRQRSPRLHLNVGQNSV